MRKKITKNISEKEMLIFIISKIKIEILNEILEKTGNSSMKNLLTYVI